MDQRRPSLLEVCSYQEGRESDLLKSCRECIDIHPTVLYKLLKQPGYGTYYSSFDPNFSVFYGDGNPWYPREVSLKIIPVIFVRQLHTT